MKRLDPTSLPGYRGEWTRDYAPDVLWGEEYYLHGDDLVVEVDINSGEYYVHCLLPLDILSEDQILEILRRNRCSLPEQAP